MASRTVTGFPPPEWPYGRVPAPTPRRSAPVAGTDAPVGEVDWAPHRRDYF
jgi:hypothetical protein